MLSFCAFKKEKIVINIKNINKTKIKKKGEKQMKEKQKGITLIALVITIIVLLILAGVSIATLTGQNGVLSQANNAKIAQAHGNVKDSMALAYNEYQLEKQTQNVGKIEKVASTSKIEIKGKRKNYLARLDTFLDFLLDKGYIESKETGKIIVDKLTGAHQVIGNGKGETDIYKIEGTEGTYKVKYYNNQGSEEEIWTVTGDESKPQGNTKSIKMIVNSGEDGLVLLPFDYEISYTGTITINWGDGATEEVTDENVATSKGKIASINNSVKVAARAYATECYHIYEGKNKEFEVEIEGKITEINSSACTRYKNKETGYSVDYIDEGREKILEITQWGETGLEEVHLSECTNLRKIASPSKNSFINIDPEYGFGSAFSGCTSLTEIPADLFSNCPQITSFERTFYACRTLTEIPQTLFDNCLNVESFSHTFEGCTGLTGNAIPLWERIEGYENLDLNIESDWENKIPNGISCYASCEGLKNYNLIPIYWKKRLPI